MKCKTQAVRTYADKILKCPSLKPTERVVVSELGLGRTLEEIGRDELGVTRERVRQIAVAALKRYRRWCLGQGRPISAMEPFAFPERPILKTACRVFGCRALAELPSPWCPYHAKARRRLLKHSRPDGRCRVWVGCIHPLGYPNFLMKMDGLGKNCHMRANRASYFLSGRVQPEGFWIMGTCDNAILCVEPSHLRCVSAEAAGAGLNGWHSSPEERRAFRESLA